MIKKTGIIGSFILMAVFSFGQTWTETFQSKDKNFFTVQSQFNEYWKDRTIEKGKGYKQFKRWEWYWENRVNPDGTFPNAGQTRLEFEKYLRNHPDSKDRLSNWTLVGPTSFPTGYGGIGRVNSIAFHPTNTNIIYAGAAGGGLWKSIDGGSNWNPTSDFIASLGVSSIVIHPTNPNTIYIATGDGDGQDNYSVGVLKSTDAGITWNNTGLSWNTSDGIVIRRMIIDPDNASSLLLASSDGIYRTTNDGSTWTQEATGNFFDIDPNFNSSTNTFYATSSSGGNSYIYKSTNNGDTWTNIQTFNGTNRIALATTPANNTYVYALCSKDSNNGFNGVYRSTDSGQSYTIQSSSPNLLGWASNGSDTGGQGWYDLCITASPTSANTIFVGGVNTWKSTNGGTSWSLNTHWSGASGVTTVHADKHALEWQGSTLWQANDGGVYRTTNGGSSWTAHFNGMVISQMYRLGVSQTDDKIITGLQDNGTKLRSNSGTWSDEIGGDGMECAIKPTNSQVMYGELYFGDIQRSTNGGSSWTSITTSSMSGNWVTPFLIDPSNPSHLYGGFDEIYKSTNQGTNWTIISSFQGSNISYFTISKSDPNYIYALEGGKLWETTNGGTNWTQKTTPGGSTEMLVVHPTNPETIWAVRQSYSGGKVFKSINGGSTWTNISGTLPDIPANCITYDEGTNDGIYVGMDVGIYYRDASMGDWILYNSGLPNVEITELEIRESTGKLYASTFGRGLWVSDVEDPSTCFSASDVYAYNVSPDSAWVTWSSPSSPPNSYEYVLNTSSTNPTSGASVVNGPIFFTNLSPNTTYFFHIRSNCSANLNSAWTTTSFDTPPKLDCMSTFIDSGGNSNYSNNEDLTWTICPSNNGESVQVSFNTFGIEQDWDALYVYDGPHINSPQISSANPVTDAGFPAGGYYGTASPGVVTSTHASGCLTFRFLSDELVTELGWTTSITCLNNCTNVSNVNDSGPGSLREAFSCALPGQQITMDNSIIGQLIDLTSGPIIVDKNIIINQTANTPFRIRSNSLESIFDVQTNGVLNINHAELYGGKGAMTQGRVFVNNGIVNLANTLIHENHILNGSGATILNNGSIFVDQNTTIVVD